jgi:hypothetical protein
MLRSCQRPATAQVLIMKKHGKRILVANARTLMPEPAAKTAIVDEIPISDLSRDF